MRRRRSYRRGRARRVFSCRRRSTRPMRIGYRMF